MSGKPADKPSTPFGALTFRAVYFIAWQKEIDAKFRTLKWRNKNSLHFKWDGKSYPHPCDINRCEGKGCLTKFLTLCSPFVKRVQVWTRCSLFGHSGLLYESLWVRMMNVSRTKWPQHDLALAFPLMHMNFVYYCPGQDRCFACGFVLGPPLALGYRSPVICSS